MRAFHTDYMNPAAFAANLVKCTKNDWQLDVKWLLSLFPSLSNVSGTVLGAEVKVDFLGAELQKDPRTALQTIMDAYLKLVKDAKQKRKDGDPWPVIVIDEANALMEWEDKKTLTALLAFCILCIPHQAGAACTRHPRHKRYLPDAVA